MNHTTQTRFAAISPVFYGVSRSRRVVGRLHSVLSTKFKIAIAARVHDSIDGDLDRLCAKRVLPDALEAFTAKSSKRSSTLAASQSLESCNLVQHECSFAAR